MHASVILVLWHDPGAFRCASIKEPVSTTQVSSGRLESSTALKGTEKFLPRPGIESGLLDCRSSVLTTILPRAWYFSVCSPEYSLRLFLQSSSDKSDWAAKPTQSSCVQRITREGSILIKEPVSTTQVSSGRLESSTALKRN